MMPPRDPHPAQHDALKEDGEILEIVEVIRDAGCGYAWLIIRHQVIRSRVLPRPTGGIQAGRYCGAAGAA